MAAVSVKRSIDVVQGWHLKECFALTLAVKGLCFMALSIHRPKGSAMLMSLNEGKTRLVSMAVIAHGCAHA